MRSAARSVTLPQKLQSSSPRSPAVKRRSPVPELPSADSSQTGGVKSPGGEPSLPLSEWCGRQGITEGNARGYYIPKGRIPGAFKLGADWYVPESSTLIRKEGGRPRKG